MRFLLGMCALFTLPVLAETQLAKIHDIDFGEHMNDEALLFLSSGKVAKINVNNVELLNSLQRSMKAHELLEFQLDDDREVMSAESQGFLPEKNGPASSSLLSGTDPLTGYTPSVLTNEFARQIFREARSASKAETQCFNRAHIWSYEWRVKHNVYSNKIWIYFTRKYIRRFNFEWWFHVAPMIHLNVDGQIKERIMDRKYSSGPLSVQKWANIFLRDDYHCPYIKQFSDYANHPESGSCFIQKSPMYYYQPVDLEYFEKYGNPKAGWLEADVRQAYSEAFDIYP